MTPPSQGGGEGPLPLTVPVTDIVMSVLESLRERDGLDRDEAYLLARLQAGETLEFREATA